MRVSLFGVISLEYQLWDREWACPCWARGRLAGAIIAGPQPTAKLEMRPDKAKVVDEVWDEQRIRSFLDKAPLAKGMDADFSALLYAYRSMRPNDFEIFIRWFREAGRNLEAENDRGETLLGIIAEHRLAQPFRAVLQAAGAKR